MKGMQKKRPTSREPGQASEQNEAAEAEAAESFEAEAAQGSERNEAAEIVEGEDAIYGSLFGKQV